MWDYAIYDMMTGDYLAPVDLASNDMARALNGGRSGSSSMLQQPGWSRDDWHDLTTPWARMLVKSHNGVPLFAHLFTGNKWDFNTNSLTLRHSDIWSLLARRTTFGTNGYSGDQPTNNNLPLVDYSLNAMPEWLIWSGSEGPTANFELPIYLPDGKISPALITARPHTGTDSRIYWDYEVHFVDSALDEVMKTEGGPDIDFQPRLSSSGKLELLMRVGALTGGSSDWMMSVAEPALFGVTHDVDALKQSNVIYAIGKGSEAGMRVRTASAEPTVPALEQAVNYKDIDDLGILQQHANADLALRNQPTHQWTASMLADAGVGVENMPPGHTLRLSFTDHPWEPDGFQTQRLVGVSTKADDAVTLLLQPTGGA